MFFWNSLTFLDDSADVGNLISGSYAFSKSSLNIWNSRFTYCWSLAWRILRITLLVCEMSAIVWQFEYSLVTFLWDWNENWSFPVLWLMLSLPSLLIYWTWTASIPLLSFIMPIFAWNVPLASLIFLKRSLVFPILLFSSISLHFLSLLVILWNCIQMGISFLFSFAFCFPSIHSYL